MQSMFALFEKFVSFLLLLRSILQLESEVSIFKLALFESDTTHVLTKCHHDEH